MNEILAGSAGQPPTYSTTHGPVPSASMPSPLPFGLPVLNQRDGRSRRVVQDAVDQEAAIARDVVLRCAGGSATNKLAAAGASRCSIGLFREGKSEIM